MQLVNRFTPRKESFYGAGPSPGCGIMRLIIQRVFGDVRMGESVPTNGEVSRERIADQRLTPIIQGDTIPLDKNWAWRQFRDR